MPLAEWTVSGNLLDYLGDAGAEETYVRFAPLTTSGALVDGGNGRLGGQTFTVPTSGVLSVTVPEGNTRVTVATWAKSHGKPVFDPITIDLAITANTTWGAVLALATSPVDPSASLIAELTAIRDAVDTSAGLAEAAAIDAEDAAASVLREASGGVMGIGSDGKIQDGKRLSPALMGLNVLEYGSVAPGGDILAALNAAIDAAKRTSNAAPAKVYIPFVTGGYLLSNAPTLASGVSIEGGGYVTLKLSASRSRMFDFTGITDVKVSGLTLDLNGNITSAGFYLPSTSADIEVDDNRWINTKTTVRAVTRKVLAGNVITLDLDNTGANAIAAGNVVGVYGVNGLASLSYADAGVFNTATATVITATATQITYAKTNADIASTATTAGWVTNGQAPVSVYAVNCDSAVRPKITRNTFTGLRAGVRLYENTISPRVLGNTFNGWGDRCIFGLGSASGNITDGKVLGNTINAASQFWGDPHQPIAFQGVAGFWHNGIEAAGNVITGPTSGGNLIAHHTGKSNNDLMGGHADSISFHHTRNLDIHDNTIRNGGEAGITVSNDCTQFAIHHNTVDGNNANPIACDWSAGVTASFVGIGSSIHDNTLINGGQERGQASTGTAIRTGSGSAIWLAGVTGILVHSNVCLDTQGTPTQLSAYYVKDVTTGLSIGKTSLQGGTTLQLNASSSYTGTIDFYATGATTAPQIDTFTTSGTWTKPAGAIRCEVVVISGGSGGGSGRRGAAASVRAGGGGGAGGTRVVGTFLASDLGSTETVTVGTGGAGGTGQTVDSTNGVDGAAGLLSAFGTSGARWLTSNGPNGGTGGAAGATTGGTPAAPGGSAGGAGSTTGGVGASANNATGKGTALTAGAGGAGGGITSADAESAGGTGALGATGSTTAPTAGAVTGGAGAAGNATKAGSRMPGSGGGGGGSSKTTAGGAGGAGSAPGGGGGGGGATLNGFTSGAGGNGADGAVYVVTYFA